jgi:methyl-accepting chemotaxis protein
MALPTTMVAGAGLAVAVGAHWLRGVANGSEQAAIRDYLSLGIVGILALTTLCVGMCVVATWWIRRQAHAELGGDPATARAMLNALADGQLDLPLSGAPGRSLMHAVDRLSAALRQIIGAIREASDGVRIAATEIANGNADLSRRTELAAGNLQQASSSMDAVTAKATHSRASAGQAQQVARSAAEAAQRGAQVVSDVTATMDAIQDSSRRIADIVGVIDGIAFQTNILALNAAVEAARAGEQGRGFAVVASEVRSLAQRCTEAAREVKSLISSSVDRVDAGSRQVAGAGTAMAALQSSVQRFDRIIGEISAAADDEALGVVQVNALVTDLDRMTQQNAALVEQSAAAAESLRNQAQSLAQAVHVFRG